MNAVISTWFEQWREPLRRWMSSKNMAPRGDLDDIVQEVFVRVMRYTDEKMVDNPQGYLFMIAQHVASEWRERCCRSRPHRPEWLEDLVEDSDLTPEAIGERSASNLEIQQAVRRLPVRQREVLLLHVNHGLTYHQIADRLGITYRMTLRDLTRAYAVLRVELARDAA